MVRTVSDRHLCEEISALLDGVTEHGERVVVTRNGGPTATLVDIDEFESLLETVEVLSDPETLAALAESLENFERGDFITLEELRAKPAERQPTGD